MEHQPASVAGEKIEDLRVHTERLVEALSIYRLCISDFQTEMQNLLLGDLFKGHRAEVRKPLDEKYRAITLDDHVALQKFFDDTDWGKLMKAAEESAKNPNAAAAPAKASFGPN